MQLVVQLVMQLSANASCRQLAVSCKHASTASSAQHAGWVCAADHFCAVLVLRREENACDILVRSNCYCYALSRYVGSYCEPGLGSTGTPLPLPVRNCAASAAGVLADGGRQVDRKTAYTVPTTGHYITLAVKPPSDEKDMGDYHFWRLDADGTWSYKAGDTLSRNTYRNGTVLRDIELSDARGAYTEFCGYFEVR